MVDLYTIIQKLAIKGIIPEKEIRDVIHYLCEMRGRVKAKICIHKEGQDIDSALEKLVELIEDKK